MKISVITLLFIIGTGPALAGADPQAGKDTAIICIGCHNRDGNSTNPAYPKLAGQGEAYLIKQLTDFKAGTREEQHMSSMVEAIEKKDIPNLAAYFGGQQRTPSLIDKTRAKRGKPIYHNGLDKKGVSACDGCHGADGRGNPAIRFPALAGQHPDYIIKMLKAFRSGERKNDPGEMMRNIAVNLTDEEIEAVAHYAAGLN